MRPLRLCIYAHCGSHADTYERAHTNGNTDTHKCAYTYGCTYTYECAYAYECAHTDCGAYRVSDTRDYKDRASYGNTDTNGRAYAYGSTHANSRAYAYKCAHTHGCTYAYYCGSDDNLDRDADSDAYSNARKCICTYGNTKTSSSGYTNAGTGKRDGLYAYNSTYTGNCRDNTGTCARGSSDDTFFCYTGREASVEC